MKLPRTMQTDLVRKCREAVLAQASRLPADTYLGQAHRQGALPALLDRLLPAFAAEVGMFEAMQLAALGKRYAAAGDATVRASIETELRPAVLRVAARIPNAQAEWERVLDSAEILAQAFA